MWKNVPIQYSQRHEGHRNGEDERQYAFGRQKLFIFMALFGEICSIAVAMFYQISRSAIKKAGGFRLNIPRDVSL